MLTGLRAGELTHLLLPDDLDLPNSLLRVRNKPKLGWQVKTRNELGQASLQRHGGARAFLPQMFVKPSGPTTKNVLLPHRVAGKVARDWKSDELYWHAIVFQGVIELVRLCDRHTGVSGR